MDGNRKTFDTIDKDGKPIKLAIIKPTNRLNQDANLAYNLKVSVLIRKGAESPDQRLLLRAELENYLSKTGIWTMRDNLKVEALSLEIRAAELQLKKGGMKISEARQLAIEMSEKRRAILDLHEKRQQFDSATVEAQAENFRFEFLLTKCLVNAETGAQYLRGHDDYINRQTEEAVVAGAKELANIVYNVEENIQISMFEMRWLKEAGLIDDEGRFVNNKGEFVDKNGRSVNEDGVYLDQRGQMVDAHGRAIDEKGNLLIEMAKPFIDDETGESVVVAGIGEISIAKRKKTKKTTTRKRVKKKVEK